MTAHTKSLSGRRNLEAEKADRRDERVRATGNAFCFDGSSDSAWRERIGNAVPSSAAQAIASEMGRPLLLA